MEFVEINQSETSTLSKIKAFLILFKESRKYSFKKISEQIKVGNTYLSDVYNGAKPATENILFKLEQFYLLDNIKQIQDIDRTISELERQKAVLQEQTVEKFYLDRRKNESAIRAGGFGINEADPARGAKAGGSLPLSSEQQRVVENYTEQAADNARKRRAGRKSKP